MKNKSSLNVNNLTLSFSGEDRELEQIFLKEYRERSSVNNFWAIVLGLFFYVLFSILDAVLLPEKKYYIWLIRFVVVSLILVFFVLSYLFSYFKQTAQLIVFFALILSGSGISFMVAIAPSPAASSYYAGVILVLMLGYGFARMRFVWASLAGWINVIVYEIIAIGIVHTPSAILVNNNFFFLSANIIGMFTCYAAESYTRRDFYLSRLLEEEQNKVKLFNKDLEEKVSERTTLISKINEDLQKEIDAVNELEKQKDRLREQLAHTQKLDSIGQLAGGIAHDFNNQLTGILGNAEMLALFVKDEKLKRFAENICRGATNGAKLTEQLLSFARKVQYEKKTIELNDILEEVSAILEHTIDKRISIVHIQNEEKPTVLGDHYQLQNAFLNIAINSRDAIRGIGTITFESTILSISDQNQDQYYNLKPGDYSCTSIIDDGYGMTEEIKSRIFEPFFTTKEVGKGTGMGLSTAYGTVKLHGGEIFIESLPGVGTSFFIFLPIIQSVRPILFEKKTIVNASEKAEILIVDDDEIIRTLAIDFLRTVGYTLHGEEDGEAGLEYFRNHMADIDLVIVDLIMPKKGGVNLYEEIRVINPDVKFLLISGKSSEESRIVKMIQMGIPFLQKPFSLSEFSDRVAVILHGE